jgi:hypothetical protein
VKVSGDGSQASDSRFVPDPGCSLKAVVAIGVEQGHAILETVGGALRTCSGGWVLASAGRSRRASCRGRGVHRKSWMPRRRTRLKTLVNMGEPPEIPSNVRLSARARRALKRDGISIPSTGPDVPRKSRDASAGCTTRNKVRSMPRREPDISEPVAGRTTPQGFINGIHRDRRGSGLELGDHEHGRMVSEWARFPRR